MPLVDIDIVTHTHTSVKVITTTKILMRIRITIQSRTIARLDVVCELTSQVRENIFSRGLRKVTLLLLFGVPCVNTTAMHRHRIRTS